VNEGKEEENCQQSLAAQALDGNSQVMAKRTFWRMQSGLKKQNV